MKKPSLAFLISAAAVALAGLAWAQGPAPVPAPPPRGDQVEVEVVYVKFSGREAKDRDALFQGPLGKAVDALPATDGEMYQRWKHNRDAYAWVEGGAVGVKAHVLREIKVARLLEKWFDQIDSQTDLKKLAQDLGLQYHRFPLTDFNGMQRHEDVGSPRAALMVFGTAGIGRLGKGYELGRCVPYLTETRDTYWPKIFDEPGNFLALFRVVRHVPAPR